MEVLGGYWLRRILARVGTITVYEGQDPRTGMPVMVLKGAKGVPRSLEGALPLLEEDPEGWVLEWPLGAVPLSQYLGVADLDRLGHWLRELARTLLAAREEGVAYVPRAELCLVKGKRLWVAGLGLPELEGEPARGLVALARGLAGERWPEFALRELLERLEAGQADLGALLAPELPPASPPEPPETRKHLSVDAPDPSPGSLPPHPAPLEAPATPPRVIRIEEPEGPPFPVTEPAQVRPPRRALLLGLLALGLGLLLLGWGVWRLRSAPPAAQGYAMEFRTDPPTERAEVVLLEVPEGSKMRPGQVLLTAPGKVEFDRKGVYRLRIRVPGREPVDYLLEVPSPPLTIKVR